MKLISDLTYVLIDPGSTSRVARRERGAGGCQRATLPGLLGLRLSPLALRRVHAFKANRRGYWSAILFVVLLVVSLFAELIANDRPLLVSYEGRLYVPVFVAYPETDFGGFLDTEADYRDPAFRQMIEEKGWLVFPPIPYRYDTIVQGIEHAPSPPTRQNLLGTDNQARDVLARIIYGYRQSVLFGLVLTALSSVIGIAAGALQGYSAAGSTSGCSASWKSGAVSRPSIC